MEIALDSNNEVIETKKIDKSVIVLMMMPRVSPPSYCFKNGNQIHQVINIHVID